MVSLTALTFTVFDQVPQEWDVFDVCLDAGVVGLGHARKEPGTYRWCNLGSIQIHARGVECIHVVHLDV